MATRVADGHDRHARRRARSGAVARPDPRRRNRAGAVQARRVEHRRSCRSRVLPDQHRRGAGLRSHRRSPWPAVHRPWRRHRVVGRGNPTRRRDHDRGHEDEPGAVGRPGQPVGMGRARGAQPRSDAGRHGSRPALRTRSQQPAELLDRWQCRQQLRRPALPGRWRHHGARARPRSGACPTARSCSWAARKRSRWVTTCAAHSWAPRECAASPRRCACA